MFMMFSRCHRVCEPVFPRGDKSGLANAREMRVSDTFIFFTNPETNIT